jgi:hypothetical protein
VAAADRRQPEQPGRRLLHYDPVLWSDGHVSNGLFYLGREGEPYIRSGVMTVPDGGYHPAHRFTIEYLELGEGTANAGASGPPQVVPRRWRATMEADHGTLTYTTTPMLVRDPDGAPLVEPNMVFRAEGEFRSRNGEVIRLSGKGHNEYMGAAFTDPSRIDRSGRQAAPPGRPGTRLPRPAPASAGSVAAQTAPPSARSGGNSCVTGPATTT